MHDAELLIKRRTSYHAAGWTLGSALDGHLVIQHEAGWDEFIAPFQKHAKFKAGCILATVYIMRRLCVHEFYFPVGAIRNDEAQRVCRNFFFA